MAPFTTAPGRHVIAAHTKPTRATFRNVPDMPPAAKKSRVSWDGVMRISARPVIMFSRSGASPAAMRYAAEEAMRNSRMILTESVF